MTCQSSCPFRDLYTGCRHRSEYAVFLLEGGSTVQKVLAYVEPPECLESSSCDWTGGWRNWRRKELRKMKLPIFSLQSHELGEKKLKKNGKDKAVCQMDGLPGEN